MDPALPPPNGAHLFASALRALAPLASRESVRLDNATRKELRRASLVLSDLNFLDDLSDADFDAWCRDTAPGDRRPLSMVNNLGGSSADHDYAVEQEYDSPSKSDLDANDLTARRSFQCLGYHRTLLLEKGAVCNECRNPPCVVCYCREFSGDLLCSGCDLTRHELGERMAFQ